MTHVHDACGSPMEVTVYTHNARKEMAPDRIRYYCPKCDEGYNIHPRNRRR